MASRSATIAASRLSTGDLMTLWAQTRITPMNLGILAMLNAGPTLDGADDNRLDAVRAAIAAKLNRAPLLRQRIQRTHIGQGRPIWADDPRFDIARHVTAVRLPGMSLSELSSWAATYAAQPLDTAHPLWRLVLVAGLESGQIGLVLVIHHALADGITAVNLARAILGSSDASPITWVPLRPPGAWELAREAFTSKLHALRHLLRTRQAPSSLRKDWRATAAAIGQRAPQLNLPVPQSTQRKLAVGQWPLDLMRTVARHRGVTINDLVLTAVAAGMRSLLLKRGLQVDGVDLRVSVPVAAPPGSRNAGGTLPIVIRLPVGIADPEMTLRRINIATRQAKAGRDRDYAGPAHSQLMPLFLVRLGTRWLRRHGSSRINLYVTNVPGPEDPLSLCGCRVTDAYPMAPIAAEVPLAVAVLSYLDTLSFSVESAPALDLDPFVQGTLAAMEQLCHISHLVKQGAVS